MNLSYPNALLFVPDLQAAAQFYRDVLGLEVKKETDNSIVLQCGLTLLHIANDHILARTPRGAELKFETDDLPAALQQLKAAQVAFLHEIHEEPWGQRIIRVYDPQKNVVEIRETTKTYVSRMKNDGLSVEEMKRKTGMTEEQINRILE
jgi:catechol 2,3-dioxygenase-like lactoylglutathione lyase family enzyme